MSGVGVGGNANFRFGVWCNASFSVFRYQHVGILSTKSSRWGFNPTPDPNASGFALQWNIGFKFPFDGIIIMELVEIHENVKGSLWCLIQLLCDRAGLLCWGFAAAMASQNMLKTILIL